MTGFRGFSAPLPRDRACRGAAGGEPASIGLHAGRQDKLQLFPLPWREDTVTLTNGQPHFQELLPLLQLVSLVFSSSLPLALSLLALSLLLGSLPLLPSHPQSFFFFTFHSQHLTAVDAGGFTKPVLCSIFALLDALLGKKLRQSRAKGTQPARVESEGEFRSAGAESPAANPRRGAFFIYFIFTSLFLFFCHLFPPFFMFSSRFTLIFLFFSVFSLLPSNLSGVLLVTMSFRV